MKPIVTTRKAAEGLELPNIPLISFFETTDGAINQMQDLLNMPDYQEDYEIIIKQWLNKYDWDYIVKMFEEELEDVLEERD